MPVKIMEKETRLSSFQIVQSEEVERNKISEKICNRL